MLGAALQHVRPSGHDHKRKYSVIVSWPTYEELRVLVKVTPLSLENIVVSKASAIEKCLRADRGG